MKNLLTLLALVFVMSRPALATEHAGNNYVEYCIPNSCVVGVFDKYGNFGVLVREGVSYNNMALADAWKMSPTGDLVARIREPYYQLLVARGLERVDFDPSKDAKEIAKLDREIQKNANKCLWMLAGCAGGALAGASSWYGIAAAAIACGLVAWDCDDLHDTNQQLWEQRRRLQEEMDAEIEKENGVEGEDDDKYIHAGDGASGGPAAGGQGGWFGPGAASPSHGGTVKVSEAPPGPMPGVGGGGGAPNPAHLH